MKMQTLSPPELAKLKLWYVLRHSVASYFKLIDYFQVAEHALELKHLNTWQQLHLHANHLKRLEEFHSDAGQQQFQQCIERIDQHCDYLLFEGIGDYPKQLMPYDDRPPILFVRGDKSVLQHTQIALVGSRKPSPHGAQVAYDFSAYFASRHYPICSGLAVGIDAAAHQGAIGQGQTVAVIGTGLDQCYPSEHQQLCQQIVDTGGAIVSEFLPNTPPAKQNFPRRNRIISGLSEATLVVEAGLKSGSLITAKTAADQGKSVFAIPGHIYSQYHQGCHQLIREGATLIDHPEQLLEDLNAFRPHINVHQTDADISIEKPLIEKARIKPSSEKSRVSKATTPASLTPPQVDIPVHLSQLYAELDWVGLSLDELASRVHTSTSELNVALVELELLGVCRQHAGRYLRC